MTILNYFTIKKALFLAIILGIALTVPSSAHSGGEGYNILSGVFDTMQNAFMDIQMQKAVMDEQLKNQLIQMEYQQMLDNAEREREKQHLEQTSGSSKSQKKNKADSLGTIYILEAPLLPKFIR